VAGCTRTLPHDIRHGVGAERNRVGVATPRLFSSDTRRALLPYACADGSRADQAWFAAPAEGDDGYVIEATSWRKDEVNPV
jgi:hypothetical protein